MAQKPNRSIKEVCEELDKLVQRPGYIYALVAMLRRDLFLNVAEAADINWRDRLSYQEFTFISGLLVKYALDLTQPNDEAQSLLIQSTYEMFDELHQAHFSGWSEKLAQEMAGGKPKPKNIAEHTRRLFGDGSTMSEPIFYGGSGAYDFQYWELAPERYALDHNWLIQNKQLDIGKAAAIIRAIKELKGAHFKHKPKYSADRNEELLDLFCVSPSDLNGHDPADVTAVFEAFSTEFGAANKGLTMPGQYNILNSHPLVKLGDGRYFVPVHFNLAQSLYESPYYWFMGDAAYKDQSVANRGAATESIADRMLAGVFSRDKVYKNVKVYRGKAVIAEIDVLAVLCNRALIVQSKSKRLTELSRTGDTKSLEGDFKKAVQQGYEQGLSCREALLNPSGLVFKAEGKEITVPEFKDAYIMCLVSDHYPALTHQAHIYLRKSDTDPYPIALSVFDLDIMTFYLKNPYEFLYYIRQRIDTADYFTAMEEIALLAFHLKLKLWKNPEHGRELIDDSWAQLVDANYPIAKGYYPKPDAANQLFREWKNADFDSLVAAAQGVDSADSVDATFLLIDLSGKSADGLINVMKTAKTQSRQDRQSHTISIQAADYDWGISYVVTPRTDTLEEETVAFGKAKKYRTKVRRWLALGGISSSPLLVDKIAFNDEPWEKDDELEQMARTLNPGMTIGKRPKVGRNQLCPCGSGKKFKRCHGV